MTNILLDVTRLTTRHYDGLIPTGVDRVGLAYIRRYGNHARAVFSERGFSTVLTESNSQRIFNLLLSPRREKNEVRSIVARALLNRFNRDRFERAILLHTSHNGMEFPRYYRTMRALNARPVFMVHDLIPLTHAEYCRPGVDATHRLRIRTALKHASGLIANSHATLDELAIEARRAGLSLPPSVVAHLAPAVSHYAPAPPPLDAPYFVMLGTIEPRKNHWFVLHLWRRLAERLGTAAPRLVIIGRRGWECENVVDMLERCAELRGLVHEESNCSDERLHALLQHARALLFPSFVEGYGLPLVEALMLRVPVIASNLAIFHEIAADIPDYLDPLDGTDWINRILAYVPANSPERSAQMARVAHFRGPTWSEHFERVDAFLDSLA
ncbi:MULTISPECIES: glycosyltransferase family 4 protein [unclassified Burkholderia]|uniref:glycosyltransferase family 4 protein n=1 Tax=unclassified Burkholderia TaxID=2613784 RepID=UPI0007567038|nr:MULTISPECIES: glycosyltransferase family 1 protein [unclassified Burkholderia]AOI77800.1 glycosyl transferase family 1 [Burkholderia sp. NRF60-BP8]KVA17829.1 glycosyl transferase family 1 [Burkholderia sp. NRF60-BP8]KVD45658.1 glycosyl transferase family 1 [Burkholderia sp. ABCPW 11]